MDASKKLLVMSSSDHPRLGIEAPEQKTLGARKKQNQLSGAILVRKDGGTSKHGRRGEKGGVLCKMAVDTTFVGGR